MATARVVWYGLIVEFDHSEVTAITGNIGAGAAVVSSIATLLAGFGIFLSATSISAIVSALLTLGSNALNSCNSRQRGVVVHVLWVGLPWCKSQ